MYEVYGYENYQTVVAKVFCSSLDNATEWANKKFGNNGWSVIIELRTHETV
jgi:hypothetical protein